MTAENEKHCTVLIHYDKGVPPTSEELSKKLESKKDSVKVEALEELIMLMIHGEPYPKLLMTIIRFVVTSNDHRLKKLLMLYWEVVEKCKENGELKEEMILVCNALRNDLMHANEYVRGSTLRLLCKMKYYRVLEPLKEAVLRNLGHRHSYVRRSAVMCVYSVVKSFGIEVMPEAPEDIEQMLLVEGDLSTKRNAFLMLLHCDQDRALKYVLSMQDQVGTMGDIFQLSVLELVRKVCRTQPASRGRCLRIVFNLASSSSTAVSYDCATTLVSLSSSPVAIHQATSAYVSLLTEQSDNNVKLIVLDRLQEVQKHHRQVIEGMVMDIMRALTCPSLDVRKKVLDISLGSLVGPRNAKDVVALLKKEVVKTLGYEAQSTEGNLEYRRLLIKALNAVTAQYSEHAQGVVFLLMDFLTEQDQTAATEVVTFLREIIAGHPELRTAILQKLSDTLEDVSQSRVLRGCLWLLGEFCEDAELIEAVIASVVKALRPLPILAEEAATGKDKKDSMSKDLDSDKSKSSAKFTTQTVVLADGTYGTKTVCERPEETGDDRNNGKDAKKSPLRTLIAGGDLLLSAMLGVTVTKLSLKLPKLSPEVSNEVLFVLSNLFKLSGHRSSGERTDCGVRLSQCIRALLASGAGSGVNLEGGQLAAAKISAGEWSGGHGRSQLNKVLELAAQNCEWAVGSAGLVELEDQTVAPDECINFRQLRERKGTERGMTDSIDDDDFSAARGASLSSQAAADGLLFAERLAKARQMSGLADPVYVEAFLQVHSFDLVLELLMVNRTNEVLQNVLVELSTQGDLKIVDRPAGVTLSPGQQMTVSASIKVASTETGVIFGYVTYEKRSATDKECTVLNELHVDILDYIERAWIGELAFRTMWSEFEWENKININTTIADVGTYLGHIMQNTNMSIVGRSAKKTTGPAPKKKGRLTVEEVKDMIREATGVQQLISSSSFVAANLYAKSIFGEDALANVSIEKLSDGKLTGSVRIRSRTQGIALSLGDRVTVVQRGLGAAAGKR
mmetsp:Transcript_27399/g.59854  ORF Transcript_27399/g.59854 Transcript_27399/m.59854 type:complete len:1016 (-) Transcript_27399:79-3126(-)|eukprot:CAMPEP_0170592390 /NCGR_PEP_ID=MMETSP0224-20130122/12899_1 /TAXON_ID=285029 /ORGANISM="Togula jolla, Strain CCCM 725" /LENGTH=1015 /DNA_ID=CAMNT_0010916293 /DNA_START=116 /DNA_END=3163 /DNA_ORIENTATION=+